MTRVVPDGLQLGCGRGGVRGVESEMSLHPGSAATLLLGWGFFTLQVHVSLSDNRRSTFLASQYTHEVYSCQTHESESDSVRTLVVCAGVGSAENPVGWLSYEVGEAHPSQGIATSSSGTFNDHRLWDHAHCGWHWPEETRSGGWTEASDTVGHLPNGHPALLSLPSLVVANLPP